MDKYVYFANVFGYPYTRHVYHLANEHGKPLCNISGWRSSKRVELKYDDRLNAPLCYRCDKAAARRQRIARAA
jgi:hypothetical protein